MSEQYPEPDVGKPYPRWIVTLGVLLFCGVVWGAAFFGGAALLRWLTPQ